MFSGSGNINVNYGWEIVLFKQIRDFSDGITFFEEKLCGIDSMVNIHPE